MTDGPPLPPVPGPPPAPPAGRRSRGALPIIVASIVIVGLLVAGVIVLATRGPSGPPEAPTRVTAEAKTCAPPDCPSIRSTVSVGWAPAVSGSPVTGYVVYRDGLAIPGTDEVPGGITSFTDEGVLMGRTFRYEVAATSDDGTSPHSDPVEAEIPLPPLAAAQLDGTFAVKLVVRHSSNLASLAGIDHPVPGKRSSTHWAFSSGCPPEEGACTTMWEGYDGRIRPEAAAWSGVVQGPPAKCFDGTRAKAPVTLDLRARRAHLDGSVWVVRTFTGTYSVTFRCPGFPPSTGTLEVSGRPG